MRRSQLISLCLILAIAFGAFLGTAGRRKTPALGLDLKGGVLVVLKPTKPVSDAILNQSIEIIRSRVDALGVAEPDISRLGRNIVVQLPGVKNKERALEIVGQTAELRFRPVLSLLPPFDANPEPPKTTTTTSAAPTTTAPGPTTSTTTPAQIPTSTKDEDKPENPVVLPEIVKGRVVQRYALGPSELTGRVVRTASARAPQTGGGWTVEVEFTSDGGKKFDDLAKAYYQQSVAIVLDGVVKSAPKINEQEFHGKATISGGSSGFSEREAKDLSLVLRFGALPVQLERQTVQEVSATLGKDSLRAGLIAGAIGLGLVLLYMVLYYRALGIVVLFGLTVSAMLMYSIITWLSETSGLTLSLAGATGIIVSVGITVDSYIVYFERLKDEIRSGKTLRSSVDRGFQRAWRTILAADISSLIGAALLYWLTVGPVRGFAFFLGLSTVIDLVTAYFFKRPVVAFLGRSRFFTEARWFGVARGLASTPTGAS
ncbi:MAG TPA: protein translocase subunit SecD [Acidimicrobiales bacterium]|nr:protein translocase subunit SecD [Acidimicrobiales bacterium]